MEEELRAALAQYEASLAEVAALLALDPDAPDTRQLGEELQAAALATREALAALAADAAASSPGSEGLAAPLDTGSDRSAGQVQEQQGAGLPEEERPAKRTRHGDSPVPRCGNNASTEPPQSASGPQQPHAASSSGGVTNPRVHPRNRYAEAEPDFAALAAQYPSLRPYVRLRTGGRGAIDFTDINAARELTRVLLEADYGVAWALPPRHLVPAVTNRANYIHWLEDLLALAPPPGGRVVGLDIGCGANCIYPLLGAALNGWRFVAVDVAAAACSWAARNVAANPHLAPLIQIRRVGAAAAAAAGLEDAADHQQGATAGQENAAPPPGAGPAGAGTVRPAAATTPDEEDAEAQVDASWQAAGVLLPAVQAGERYTFSMCNPPFFATLAEAGANPATAFGGTASEMVCPGGELAFVSRMAQDSVELGDSIHWYTTLVGKKATLKALRALLHHLRVTALRTTEFAQGRTSRWGVAWSFSVGAHLAAHPLPRPAPAVPAARPQATTQPRQRVSFMLQQPKLGAGRVLRALAAALEARGASCQLQEAQFSLSATLPCAAAEPDTVAEAPPGAGTCASSQSPAAITHTSSGGVSSARAVAGLQDSAGVSVRAGLFQEGPGRLTVTLTVPNGTSDAAACVFSLVASQVEADVRQAVA